MADYIIKVSANQMRVIKARTSVMKKRKKQTADEYSQLSVK